jgi:diguanylate cyclase (GGDEF)-like protein/PAS domain S-box-containing protein
MDDPAAHTEDELRAQLARAMAALRAQEARAELVQGALRVLPDGIVLVDQAGRVADLNLGAMHLTGWTEAQALGRPLHDVVKLRDSHGRSVDLLATGHWVGGDVTRLVRRDEHQVLVDATFVPIHDSERRPAGAVVAFRNVTAATRINDELTYLATHDALTGLFNRRVLETRLDRAVAHAAQHGTPYALVYLDLDRFKPVNDTGGHVAGDELLRVLSSLLQQSVRDQDTLARLGGDEFAVLLEHCVLQEAKEIAERIRESVAALRFRWVDQEFTVSASIGLVAFRGGAMTSPELLQRADEMCYRAKSEGRNQVQVFQSAARAVTPRSTRSLQRKAPPLRH